MSNQPCATCLDRRRAAGLLAALAAAAGLGPASAAEVRGPPPLVGDDAEQLRARARAAVAPAAGFQSRIRLGDAVPRLVAAGVIDPAKFLAMRRSHPAPPPLDDAISLAPVHRARVSYETVPVEIAAMLRWPDPRPIRLTAANAGHYLNLLWPLGLANRTAINEESPINGSMLARYASTSGWTLGREPDGAGYFNRHAIVPLSPAEEERVLAVAQATYRPCCDNATFFQDCNHGSALLAVLELGAAQGLDEDALYRESLGFNSYWFTDEYVQTAMLFDALHGTAWEDADPRLVLGYTYSALGPWSANVRASLALVAKLAPDPSGGAICGL